MHPDADALLDAIFDAPDDDTPRLVYADWLQEHGQEAYAQFIRLQCAAACHPLWSDEANRLWEEIGRVWTRLDEEWWPATRDKEWRDRRCGYGLDAIHFDRGFLCDSGALTCSQLCRYSGLCWQWLPLPVTTLREGEDDVGEWLIGFQRLSRIRHLRLETLWHGERNLRALIYSPHLSQLETLDLSGAALTSDEVERMLAPGSFSRLREVLNLYMFDSNQNRSVAGCLTADIDTSALHLARLRRRFEARFEKVVWRTGP